MEPFVLSLPTRLVFGPGTLETLGAECAGRFRRPALVTGQATLARGGLGERLRRLLAENGISPVPLPGVAADPSAAFCDDLARRARAAGCDGVLGVGGGSAMDAAKAVAMLLASDGETPLAAYLREWEGDVPPVTGRRPLALVPTTVGTGTEVNSGMVITDAERGHKLTFFHPALHADLAVVDPDLTASLPPRQLRLGLFDAFCHLADGILAATAAFTVTERLAETLARRLVELSADPEPADARAELAHLSLLALSGLPDAGLAGHYPLHDLAAPVTARLGIPHAAALALLFPALAAFDAGCDEGAARANRLHAALDPARGQPDLPSFLRAFIARLGIRPASAPPPDDLLETMAADCLTLFGGGSMRVANIRPLGLIDMTTIYREAFAS